jgi:AcrR family transcriptional regulator
MSERRYHVGDLRSRLLREARGMLEEGALKDLNLRALAARTGIAPGSMYHHFDSKAALLAELAAGGFHELRRELETAVGTAAPGGRLRGWARAYFRFAERAPALFSVMFDAEIARTDTVAAARDAALDGLRRLLAEVAEAQGRADAPIRQITLAVWAASHGAAGVTAAMPDRAQVIDDVIAGLEALFRPRV